MGEITRVGVDLAKRVIQVHAVDATGRVIAAKQLQRDGFTAWCAQLPPGCLVAMEACSGSHHWGRRLQAMGLQVKLIAPHFVSPYRLSGKTGKNDAADAAAICEAASRPSIRFVPVKSVEQQSRGRCTDGEKATRKSEPPASTGSAACWPSSVWSSRSAPKCCEATVIPTKSTPEIRFEQALEFTGGLQIM